MYVDNKLTEKIMANPFFLRRWRIPPYSRRHSRRWNKLSVTHDINDSDHRRRIFTQRRIRVTRKICISSNDTYTVLNIIVIIHVIVQMIVIIVNDTVVMAYWRIDRQRRFHHAQVHVQCFQLIFLIVDHRWPPFRHQQYSHFPRFTLFCIPIGTSSVNRYVSYHRIYSGFNTGIQYLFGSLKKNDYFQKLNSNI